jgi:lipopolysaccharide export system permease protein
VKRIDRALLAEALPALVFGALLYSVLAVTSATLPRLTWLVGAGVGELLRWLVAQLPTALAQTMPIAMVLAVLLTFGRMEGDKELLALRAGGVALGRIIAPMLVLGALAAGGTLAVYQWVTPRTHAWVATEYWRMTAGGTGLFRLAGQALPVGEFALTFDGTAGRGSRIVGVRIERWEGERLTLVRADEAVFEGTDLLLTGYRTQIFDLAALDREAASPEARLRDLVRLDNRAADPESQLRLSVGVSEEELVSRFSRGGFEDDRSLTELASAWRSETAGDTERRTAGVLLMRRLAEPFANLVLLLVALPLSLGWARGRGVAFGLSLVVTLLWYLLVTLGQFAAQSGTLPIVVGPWIANAVLGAVGVVLLVRLRTR